MGLILLMPKWLWLLLVGPIRHRVRKQFEKSLSCDSGVETLHRLEFDIIVLKCTTVEVQYVKNWGTLRLAAVTDWTISKCFLAGRVLCWRKEKKNQRSNFYNSVFWFQQWTQGEAAWQSIQLCVCACYAWSSTCILTNTLCAFAELNEAHLLCSCSTQPTLQALSLCVLLGNSHSLFTFAFLHCDSHQNNVAPAPLETDCQAFFIQSSMKQRLAFVWACSVCIFLETLRVSLHV